MRTKNRVTAIIVKKEQVLLIHRKREGQEYWTVVGGGAEEGETLDEALKREVYEEVSLKVLNYKYLGDSKGEYKDDILFYECEIEEGEPKLGGPEKDYSNENNWYNPEWVSLKELEKLSLYPASAKKFIKAGSK